MKVIIITMHSRDLQINLHIDSDTISMQLLIKSVRLHPIEKKSQNMLFKMHKYSDSLGD